MSDTEQPMALVTGAGRGIGRAVAIALAEKGLFVFINYVADETAAAQTRDDILKSGGQADLLPFDVTDADAAARAVKTMVSHGGRIDVLVNNAGIRQDGLLAMMKPMQWARVVDTGLTGFFNVTRPVVRTMIKQHYGRIVNMVSAAGQTGNQGQVNYSAAKAGLIGATKALAREVASRGITVNAVSPGFIQTDMTRDMAEPELAASIPAGRLGTPEEVAYAVLFLCHPQAAYISGQVIGVNGGLI